MGRLPGELRKLMLSSPLMTGDDVRSAQRVLHTNRFKINFHPGKADRQYGPKTAAATRLAKCLLGYPEAEVNDEFGPNLYGYLVAKGTPGYKHRPSPFIAPSVTRRRQFKAQATIRERMVTWCRWGIKNSAQIHFAEDRPMPIDALPGALPLTLDCSASTTLFAKWAGAPDPNGLSYNGEGSTEAMLAHLKQITADALQPGDLIVFDGPPKKQHAVVVLEPGDDPIVESHGGETGPLKLTLSQEAPAHPGTQIIHLALV